jgi:uncharacterized protein (TIGR00730 family)
MAAMRVAVFGSSRNTTPKPYLDEAFKLGARLAKEGMVCTNGGGGQGVMGAANDGVRSANGKIIGVIHEMFCVDNDEDRKIANMIKATGNDLNERKQLLMDNADCFVIMPGGTGTFDELWDIVSHRSLGMKGLKGKEIIIVNLDGFYDGSIMQLKRAFNDKILYNPIESYFTVVANGDEAFEIIQRQRALLEKSNSRSSSSSQVDSRITSRASNSIVGSSAPSAVLVGSLCFAAGLGLASFLAARKQSR